MRVIKPGQLRPYRLLLRALDKRRVLVDRSEEIMLESERKLEALRKHLLDSEAQAFRKAAFEDELIDRRKNADLAICALSAFSVIIFVLVPSLLSAWRVVSHNSINYMTAIGAVAVSVILLAALSKWARRSLKSRFGLLAPFAMAVLACEVAMLFVKLVSLVHVAVELR